MKNFIGQSIHYFKINPRKLFLADCFGAFITCILLLAILFCFQGYIGMPISLLQPLFVLAAFCFWYSFFCFLFLRKRYSAFLKGIALANLVYCLLSMLGIISFFSLLTPLGVLFFLFEIVILFLVVYIELRVAFGINGI